MREDELRNHSTCSKCKKPIGHTGLPLFWTADIKRHGLKRDALQRQQGLTMLLGGSAALAHIMGPDEEMTNVVMSEKITLCEDCGMDLFVIIEQCLERKDR